MHIGVRKEDACKRNVIYAILCLENGKAYVGQTRRTLDARWRQHVKNTGDNYTGCSALRAAMRKYGADNFSVHVLQSCGTIEELDAAEVRWIAELGTFPVEAGRGYNLISGGGSGRIVASEIRHKLSLSHIGKSMGPHSEEHKNRIAASCRGRKLPPVTDATKRKLAIAGTGRVLSAEARAKISASKKGVPLTAETRAKLSAAHTGKRHTIESRAKMSMVQKGLKKKRRR